MTAHRMTALEAAAAAGQPVLKVGGAFMTDEATIARGMALGAGGWPFYYLGRGGVFGDVDPDVIAGAFVFFPAERLRKAWLKARAVMTPATALAEFTEACREWGRRNLADVAGLGELVALGRRVVEAVDPAGLPLFAGWRAVPMPDDLPGAAAQVLQVLREHRGGLHGVAVLASGLTPLQAVVSAPEGVGSARFVGWPEPWPDPAPYAEARAAAEALTDRLAAPAYEVLSADERDRLVELVTGLAAR